MAPSSSGQGHPAFDRTTRVQIPLGLLLWVDSPMGVGQRSVKPPLICIVGSNPTQPIVERWLSGLKHPPGDILSAPHQR